MTQYDNYMNLITNGNYGLEKWRIMIAQTLDDILERLENLEKKVSKYNQGGNE